MCKCKYLQTEIKQVRCLGGDNLIDKINICTIKEELVDKEKIKLIIETELKLGCLGGGVFNKICLFSNQKDCPYFEE